MSDSKNLYLDCKECKKEISVDKTDYSQCPECHNKKFYVYRKTNTGRKCFEHKYCPNHPNKLIDIGKDDQYENVCCQECLKEIKSVVVDDINSPARINYDMCNECGKANKVWSPDNASSQKLEAEKQKLKNEDNWCSCQTSNQINRVDQEVNSSQNKSYLPWILGGVAGLGLIGVVVYFATRKKERNND